MTKPKQAEVIEAAITEQMIRLNASNAINARNARQIRDAMLRIAQVTIETFGRYAVNPNLGAQEETR